MANSGAHANDTLPGNLPKIDEQQIDNPEITVHLSPWPNPNTGVHSDSYLELPFRVGFTTRFRRAQSPEYSTQLRVWVNLPFESVTVRSPIPHELDPEDSPYLNGPGSHTLALGLEDRQISIAVRLRPNSEQKLDRWLHIKLKNERGLIHDEKICRNAGIGLEPIGPHLGTFSWVSLACVVVDKGDRDRRLYGVLRHSADSELVFADFAPTAESGGDYELINLLKLRVDSPLEFKVRRKGAINSTRIRLAVGLGQPPKGPPTWVTLGLGLMSHAYSGDNGSQNQAGPVFSLQTEKAYLNSNRTLHFEAWVSGPSLVANNPSLPKATYLGASTRTEWTLPWCPFELIDSPCRLGVGARVWGLVSSPSTMGSGSPLAGPELHLRLIDGADHPTRHEAYLRLALYLGSGLTFGFANHDTALGARFHINSTRAPKALFLKAELGQVATGGTRSFQAAYIQSRVEFEL